MSQDKPENSASEDSPWVDLMVFLTERRDYLKSMLSDADSEGEKTRIGGAVAELTWVLEQLLEKRVAWAQKEKSQG